jgi:phosphoribosylanthranilate isomerase
MSSGGRTRVCVYGVRSDEEALAAAEAGADGVGFFFNPRSARFVEPEEAWEIAAVLPPLVSTVGVLENATVEKFLEIEERCPTDYSHLHGNEPEDVARQCGTRAIKTIRGDAAALEREAQRWAKVDEIDALMVALEGAQVSDPEVLAAVGRIVASRARPVLVGGGLTAENVGGVIAAARPWAVVVSGGVEDEAGRKSAAKMAAFCRAVAAADGR